MGFSIGNIAKKLTLGTVRYAKKVTRNTRPKKIYRGAGKVARFAGKAAVKAAKKDIRGFKKIGRAAGKAGKYAGKRLSEDAFMRGSRQPLSKRRKRHKREQDAYKK